MVPPADLEEALSTSLPAHLHVTIPSLVSVLTEAQKGTLSAEDVQARLVTDLSLAQAIRALAGQQIEAGKSLISFGSEAQVGDVRIGDLAGRDVFKITVHLPPLSATLTPQERRNRHGMLRKVRAYWIDGLLQYSLAEVVHLELSFAEPGDALALPLNMQYQELQIAPRDLPTGTSITDVFLRSAGGLLLLGAPGAGKTTLLLELCRDLLERADRDEIHPIPVVFNLSSWALKRGSLDEWLVDELNAKYDVPTTIARAWIAQDEVLPLLDGLDEVAPMQREACVEAVNGYRKTHFVPLVVCSRLADYYELTERVRLDNAILIQPLTDAQIDRFLARDTPRLQQLRAILAKNGELRALATTPLLLNVMLLTAHALDSERHEQMTQVLWDTYICEVYQRRKRVVRSRWKIIDSLHWMSAQMKRLNQSIFLLERLGPSWMPNRWQQRLIDIVEGAFVGMTVGLAIATAWFLVGTMTRVQLGIRLIELITGYANPALANSKQPLWAWCIQSAPMALNSTLLMGGVFAFIYGITRTEANTSTRRTIYGALMIGAAITLLSGAIFPDVAYIGIARSLAIFAGIGGGGVYVITERRGRNALVEDLRIVPQRFIRGLIIGIIIGAGAGLVFALLVIGGPSTPDWTARFLPLMFTGIASGALLGSLLGLTEREVSSRGEPNQGIRRSLRSAYRTGISSSLALGIVLSTGVRYSGLVQDAGTLTSGFIVWLCQSLPVGLVWSFGFGVAMGLLYGGITCLQHLAARFVMWACRSTPLRLVSFLEDCTDRALIYRVGGGYIFIHRLLLEHFAAMRPGDIMRLDKRISSVSGVRQTIA